MIYTKKYILKRRIDLYTKYMETILQMNQEYILCAAIKRKHPIKLDSYNYQTNNRNIDDIYIIEIGRRHNDILARFSKSHLDVHKQGFYTSYGRFVDREEALLIAKKAGQVQEHLDKKLFSEDLY